MTCLWVNIWLIFHVAVFFSLAFSWAQHHVFAFPFVWIERVALMLIRQNTSPHFTSQTLGSLGTQCFWQCFKANVREETMAMFGNGKLAYLWNILQYIISTSFTHYVFVTSLFYVYIGLLADLFFLKFSR